MSYFGDVETHRKVLDEILNSPEGEKLKVHMRNAAMGAFGLSSFHPTDASDSSAQRLPFPLLQAAAPLLSLTVAVARFSKSFIQYQKLSWDVLQYLKQRALELQSPQSDLAGFPLESDELVNVYKYLSAYWNYLMGFLALWKELFGCHYRFSEDGIGSAASRGCREETNRDQMPPHMYLVSWELMLSPERRSWCRSLYEVTKEILFNIAAGVLPFEFYFLFILYAALSLRVRLLETVSEQLVWSSRFVDVGHCVQVMYSTHRMLFEMSSLQKLWASFELIDTEFVNGCSHFHRLSVKIQEVCLGDGILAPDVMLIPCFDPSTPGSAVRVWGCERALQERPISLHAKECSRESNSTSPPAGASFGPLPPETCPPSLISRCEFIHLLHRMAWDVSGRCSLWFRSCVHVGLLEYGAFGGRRPSPPPLPSEAAAPSSENTNDDPDENQHHSHSHTNNNHNDNNNNSHDNDDERRGSGGRGEKRRGCSGGPALRASPPSFLLHYTVGEDGEEAAGGEGGGRTLPLPSLGLRRGSFHGSHPLAAAFAAGLHHPRFWPTLLGVTNHTTRAGAVGWRDQQLQLRLQRQPSEAGGGPAAARSGMAPWVLNFVMPHGRLAVEAARRQAQEALLLRTIVFQVAGRETEQVCFAHENALFYVLNSGPHLDGGRMYFVLHLYIPPNLVRAGEKAKRPHSNAPKSLDREEALLLEEKDDAFFVLENLRKQWCMPGYCSTAVALAAALPDSRLS